MLAVAAILKRLTAAIAALDPYFNNVSLLITGNGVDGSGNKTFIDSASGLPISIGAGQPTQGSFNPFNSNYAGVFDGSSYLRIVDSTALKLAGVSWTIEFWVYVTSWHAGTFFSKRSGTTSYQGYLTTNGAINYYDGIIRSSTATLPTNTWSHLAYVHNGTTITVYLNGVPIINAASTVSDTTNPLFIGAYGGDGTSITELLNGQISNLRITKGYALYTSNFTPQAILSNAPLGVPLSAVSLLTLQDGAFVDLSTNNRAISAVGTPKLQPLQTSYPSYRTYDVTKNNAVYFSGSPTRLSTSNTNFDFINNTQYTIEGFVYIGDSSVAIQGFFYNSKLAISMNRSANTGNNYVYVGQDGGTWIGNGPSISVTTASDCLTLSAWNHIALVRNGSNLTLYHNGKNVGSTINVPTGTVVDNTIYIGSGGTIEYLTRGYISNFRITRSALYTSNFTPPKEPLTSISNGGATPSVAPVSAALLTCQNTTFTDNGNNNLTITTNGTPSIASGPRYNAYLPVYDPTTCNSVYFDGSSYLTIPYSTSFDTNQTFTLEFWVNASNVTTLQGLYGKGGGNNLWNDIDGYELITYISNSKINLQYHNGSGNTQYTASSPTITPNTWYHVSVTYDGTNYRAFLNGTVFGTNSTAVTLPTNSTVIYLGQLPRNGDRFTGYISNLRYIKGTALYTSNFTPPVEPFTTTFNGGATPSIALSGSDRSTLLTCRSTTIKDDSSNALTLTTTGNPIVTNRNPFVLNTTSPNTAPIITPAYDSTVHNSVYFDGSSYLKLTDDASLELSSNDFTIEFWFNTAASNQYTTFLGKALSLTYGSGMWQIFANLGGSNGNIGIGVFDYSNTTNLLSATDKSYTDNAWHHLAWVRSGTSHYLFIDGILKSTRSSVSFTIADVSGTLEIGRYNGFNDRFYTGNISNLRIIKGSALYTSNFTPSISGLTSLSGTSLLTCQDSTIRDNSSNNLALSTIGNPTVTTLNPFGVNYSDYKGGFYGGSGYFDGSSYLTPQVSNIADFGTSDFTIEFWFNSNTTGVVKTLLDSRDSGTDENILLNLNASNTVEFSTGNTLRITSNTTIVAGAWYHFALTKTGGTTRMFINGVQQTTTFPDTTTYKSGTNRPIIGATGYTLGVQLFNGYISNLRIIKGSALYTANFAPPTAPVRPTSNSSLLLNFSNAGVYDVTRKNNLIQYGTASVSTSASKFGGGAMYFDGSSYLTSVNGDNFNFGTGNFTVEMWVYPTANAKSYPTFLEIGNHNNTTGILFTQQNQSGNVPQIYSGGWYSPTNTPTLTLSAWNHLVYQRSSGNLKIFVNGAGSNTVSFTNNITDTRTSIGYASSYNGGSNYYYIGYIDDLRITKGIARYTANFAVPTRELPSSNITLPDGDTYFNNVSLLLRCDGLSGAQNNTFLDSSVNNVTVTRSGNATQGSFSPFSTLGNVYNVGVNGGSLYVEGGAGTAHYPETTIPAINTSDNFTLELWAYWNSFGSSGYRVTQTTNDRLTLLMRDSAGKLDWYNGTNSVFGSGSDNFEIIQLNKWYHIAITRNGGTLRAFVNGILKGTAASNTDSYDGTGTFRLGQLSNMYISNFRFVKGLAVYTAAFTPPTAPVTLTSNGGATPSTAPTAAQTSLLLNFTNAGIVDAVGKNNLVTVGNARIDTAIKKYGTGSIYFDGTGDYLTIPAKDQYNFSTGNWTVEFWVYPLAYGGTTVGAQLFGTTNGAQTGYSINLGENIDKFRVISNASGSWVDDLLAGTGNGPSLNTWTHFAVVRNSGTLTIYKNGISVATKTGISAYNYSGTTGVIGRFAEGLNTRDYNGYIDDLRVTKGVARYTSNFTPPTAPLQIQGV